MPNRIVREAILTSGKVDQLDNAAEVFYRRLLNVVDDYGRYDARPAVLRSACFPLRADKVREADCSRWLAICEKAGLIVLYEVGGKPYLVLLNLGEPRAKTSRFPDPPDDACAHVNADADTCMQMRPNTLSNAPTPTPTNTGVPPEFLTAKGAVIPESLRVPVFLNAWKEWERYHVERRTKTTAVADVKQLAKCERWGPAAAAVNIDFSITSNWQGIFPAKVESKNGTNGATASERKRTAVEQALERRIAR